MSAINSSGGGGTTKRSSADTASSSNRSGGSIGTRAGTNSRSPVAKQHRQQHNHSLCADRNGSHHSSTKKRRGDEMTKSNGVGADDGPFAGSSRTSPRRHSMARGGGLGAALEQMRERNWAAIAGTSSAAPKPSVGERMKTEQYKHHRHHQSQHRQQTNKWETKDEPKRRLTFSNSHLNKHDIRGSDDDNEEEEDEENDNNDGGRGHLRQDGAGTSADGAGTSSSLSDRQRMLPLSKVRTIMESSPNVSELKLSAEAMFAMSKAAEAFISLLAKGAHRQMLDGSQHTRVGYNELAMFVEHNEELNFIQDILPRKLKFSEVQKMMATHRR